MGKEYVVRDQGAVHFVTFTVHQWVDVFTRKAYAENTSGKSQILPVDKGAGSFCLGDHEQSLSFDFALKE